MNEKVIICAMASIVILEAIALIKGINGVVLSATIAVLAGLAGWIAPQLKLK